MSQTSKLFLPSVRNGRKRYELFTFNVVVNGGWAFIDETPQLCLGNIGHDQLTGISARITLPRNEWLRAVRLHGGPTSSMDYYSPDWSEYDSQSVNLGPQSKMLLYPWSTNINGAPPP